MASTLIFRGEGDAVHTLFYLTDFGGEPGYGLFYTLVNGLPFYPAKVSPKPGVPMIRAAITEIGTAHPVGKIDYLGKDIWGYVFQDETNGELVAALWDASDQDRHINFETGADRVQVGDEFGNRETRSTQNGQLRLQLRRAPQYVRGLLPVMFLTQTTPPVRTERIWRVFRGQKVTQNVVLASGLGKQKPGLTYQLSSEVAKLAVRGVVRVGTTGEAKVPIEMQVSPTAPLGMSVASVRVAGAGGTLYHGLQRIEVVPELQISPLALFAQGNRWFVAGKVKNASSAIWRGHATASMTGFTQGQALVLKPGEEKVVRYEVALPADVTQFVPVKLALRATSGSELKRTTPLSFFAVQRAGVADVWRQMKLLPLRATQDTIFRTFREVPFGGDTDLSAQASYAADENNLYVQYQVQDDIHRNSLTTDRIWRQDSLQLAFDVAPDRQKSANNFEQSFEATDSEWGFAFTDHGPEIYLFRAPGGGSLASSSSVTDPGVRLEGGREGTITTYNITISWKLLDPHHLHGQQLGLAGAVNDSDHDMAFLDRRALLLFQGIVGPKDPALFGRALLQ